MITQEQIAQQILNNIMSMEDGIEYVLTEKVVSQYNDAGKKYGYSVLSRDKYILVRKGFKLFCNGDVILDCSENRDNIALALALAVAFALTFPFAHIPGVAPQTVAIARYALQYNEIEKLNKDSCDGKLIEIEGKKYRLKLEE